MKKYFLLMIVLTLFTTPTFALNMPLDGSWTILDENMVVGTFFANNYEWNSPYPVNFTITDLFVASDRFEVYDSGSLVFTTPTVADWTSYAATPFTAPPFTNDPDIALASGYFSSMSWLFGVGSHDITIKDIYIPPTDAGGPFPDGTVAFKANVVPEPSTFLLLGSGLAGLAFVARRRKKS